MDMLLKILKVIIISYYFSKIYKYKKFEFYLKFFYVFKYNKFIKCL